MSTYICPRCGYEKTRHSDMVKHLNRKNMCKPLIEDIIPTIDNIIKRKL